MKVLFNGDVIRNHNSGVGNYAVQLLKQFAVMKPENMNMTVNLGSRADSDLFHHFSLEYHNRFTKYMPFDLASWGDKYEVYHEPNFVPAKFSGRTVVTIHDVSYRMFPECHAKNRLWRLRLFEKRMTLADRIITVSESSKCDIVKCLDIDPEKIFVTYLGCDSAFRPYDVSMVEIGKLREFNVQDNYLLYVGNIEPRKNLVRLLDAFYIYHKKSKSDIKLVLAGGDGWQCRAVYDVVRKYSLSDRVIFTGFFPQHLLPALYNRARALIYPSIYEGFGLPVLEAMACGLPVLVANTASIPEVAGDAGVYFHPEDVEEIADVMQNVLSDERKLNAMRKDGLVQANKFSWVKCASETLDIYRDVGQL